MHQIKIPVEKKYFMNSVVLLDISAPLRRGQRKISVIGAASLRAQTLLDSKEPNHEAQRCRERGNFCCSLLILSCTIKTLNLAGQAGGNSKYRGVLGRNTRKTEVVLKKNLYL